MIQVFEFYVTYSGQSHAIIVSGAETTPQPWNHREVYSSPYRTDPHIPEDLSLTRIRPLTKVVGFSKRFERLPLDSR